MIFNYSWNGADHPYSNLTMKSDDDMVMMMSYNNQSSSPGCSSVEDVNTTAVNTAGDDVKALRRGPWTVEEDIALINYIAVHGEGRWNSLARCAGLNRTGKSCRLRWLNYLRPDVRRGNLTPEEQLLILELHSRWGNRWSKIAEYLPGRTDNEIKNYWRTRVQKHAKQLKCDVNSQQFKDTMRYLWMPRLVERIQAQSTAAASSSVNNTTTTPHRHPTTNAAASSTITLDQHLYQYSRHNWHYSAAAATPSCNNNYVTTSDNSSDSVGNQLVVSPAGEAGDYYTSTTTDIHDEVGQYHYALQETDNQHNHKTMSTDQVSDGYAVGVNSSANCGFNQYIDGGQTRNSSSRSIGLGFQWLEDVDVVHGGVEDYHTSNVELWNSADDVNSYGHLQLPQELNGANNQFRSHCAYF